MKNFIKSISVVAALVSAQLSFGASSMFTAAQWYEGATPHQIKLYKFFAKTAVGATVSCKAVYNSKKDSLDVTPFACTYKGDTKLLDYVAYGNFGLNGWDIVSQQFTPGDHNDWPVVYVVFKKTQITKTYNDINKGEYPGKL